MLNLNNIPSLEGEIWKSVNGYENIYWVSDKGRIHNGRKLLKFYRINSGYLCVDLTCEGSKSKWLVHRLVALHYCENPLNLPEVNHDDEDKDNNAASNLAYCTSSFNKRHSMATGTYDKIYETKNSLGKKHLPYNPSQYFNVGFDKTRGKWTATIRHEGKNLERKRFNTELEAALHVNYLIDKYKLFDRPKNII
jgi:hypothetical protein